MLIPAPPLYPRRRNRKVRPLTSAPAPAALEVIGVENVAYDEPMLTFTLVLNTSEEDPLVADPLDAEKWSGTYQGGAMTPYAADVVAFDRITVTLQGVPGAGGASTVSYAAGPSDVSDATGRQLAAFSDFPL
jgi:hypothetical protein